MNPDNPLILVDGSQYLFRAFYGLPEMRTAQGAPTHAIRGVVSMLRKLSDEYKNSTIVVIFDAPGKTFRDDIFSEYKAGRPKMDEDMRVQIEPIHKFVKALGFPLLVVPGVEADDVMGTLARQATERQIHTIISSNDKDLAQLVNEFVVLQDSEKDTNLGPAGVFEKFEVKPEQIIDYLALMGDKVDNIPGIPGVGKKTAAKWLQEYDDLDTVITNADQIKGKVGERLRENLDKLPLSRQLATIDCHVELEESVDTLKRGEIDQETVLNMCREYQFRRLTDQFLESFGRAAQKTTTPSEGIEPDITSISEISQIEGIVQAIEAKGEFTVSLAADSTGILNHKVAAIAITLGENKVSYIRCQESMVAENDNLKPEAVMATLRAVFENESLRVIAHDIKLLRHVLRAYKIELKTQIHDVMLASYVLNSVGHGEHSIKGIAGTLLERTVDDDKDLLGTGRKQLRFNDVGKEALQMWVATQVCTVHELHELTSKLLIDQEKLNEIYNSVELALERHLFEMEHHGAVVKPEALHELNEELAIRKEDIETRAYESVGHEFNMASPKQLETVLYDVIGLEGPSKTKKGSRSTKEDVLKGLVNKHELPELILAYRATTKLMSTYIAGLLREINPTTGRIHTTYSQANASTGRLASVNPNLQNIPIRTPDGRRVREAFVSPPGFQLMTVDYSQIELRVMAHITDDPGLTEAFSNQIDIHQATASDVFGTPFDQVDDDQRRSAKAINFGLMYGMSPFGLARELGVTNSMAKQYIDTYFTRYPKVLEYVETIKTEAAQNGHVETVFGRRVPIRDINNRNPIRRQAAERLAINAPVQGSAADIIKKATIDVGQWLETSGLNIVMILQVHDELVFEVADEDLDAAKTHISQLMTSAAELKVPLEVDVGVATNWSLAH